MKLLKNVKNCYNCARYILNSPENPCIPGSSNFTECFEYEITKYPKWKPVVGEDLEVNDSAHNNGGATDYYDLPEGVKECQGIIEWRKMNFAQGNMFKSTFCFNTDRHGGTSYKRELNKIIYFAQRELQRINRGEI